MIWWVIGAACWVGCGVVSAGLCNAEEQSRFPKLREPGDLGHWLLFGLVCGPIALVVAFFLTGFGRHGWRLHHIPPERRPR
jgi:hypothetical protein